MNTNQAYDKINYGIPVKSRQDFRWRFIRQAREVITSDLYFKLAIRLHQLPSAGIGTVIRNRSNA